MGDSCCNPHTTGAVVNSIKEALPSTYVLSIATGKGLSGDVMSSYFGSVNDQIDTICDELSQDPELADGFTAVGFSQGGQFLRGLVQRCGHFLNIHTVVTMGAQHQGVMEPPGCWAPSFNTSPSWQCKMMEEILARGSYLPWVQHSSVQAQYFKDPYQMDTYKEASVFLADINLESTAADNKYAALHDKYRSNILALQKLVLYQFDNDVTVVPKESSQFGFYDGEQLLPLEETDVYIEDRLGLKEMADRGDLVLESAPGFHMQFSLEWFVESVLHRYLAVKKNEGVESAVVELQ